MQYRTILATLLCTAVISAAPPRINEELTGRVVAVTDGDTVKVLAGREQVTVRLEGIDAPESGQSFGTRSKEALADMVFSKTVVVQKTGTDQYGRTLGKVIVDGVDSNAKMVEGGWAWHYKQYSKDQDLAELERKARSEKRGLWDDPHPLPPWEFRARKRAPKPEVKAPDSVSMQYWLNTSSGVRHNQRCEHFGKTKNGRDCGANEGRPCGRCGG